MSATAHTPRIDAKEEETMIEPVHISDDELKKMHACAPMLEPPAGDELRRVIDQVLAERRETARLRALAASWIRTARVLAIENLRRGTERAADKALADLGEVP